MFVEWQEFVSIASLSAHVFSCIEPISEGLGLGPCVLVDCGFTMVCVCVCVLFYFLHGCHGVANALKICRQHWGESCEDEPSEDRVAGSPMSQGSCVEWLNVSCAKYVE